MITRSASRTVEPREFLIFMGDEGERVTGGVGFGVVARAGLGLGPGAVIDLRGVRGGVLTSLGLRFREPRLFAPVLVSSHEQYCLL